MFNAPRRLCALTRNSATALAAVQVLAVFLGLAPEARSQSVTQPPQILAGYYGNTPGTTKLASLVKSGAALHLTHLIYAFAAADEASPCTGAPTISASDLKNLKALRAANTGLKILISVGGQNSGAAFQTAVNDAAFASNCVNALMKDTPNQGFQFDGIDIDWETPGSTTDEQNFNFLLHKFRSALNKYQLTNHLAQRLLLTAAITPEHTASGWLYIDFAGQTYAPGATSAVDFFNVELYEYAFKGDGITESNAPLYEINADLYGDASVYGADQGIITDGKVPPKKIVLGIPFYGVHFTSVGSGTALGESGALESTAQGNVTYPYYELHLKPGILYNDGTGSSGCKLAPRPRSCDGIGASAWIWNSSTQDLWSFDNPETIKRKAQYAQAHQLGGLMSWNLMDDTPGGALLNAMAAGLATN